jgi:hypothetical protein
VNLRRVCLALTILAGLALYYGDLAWSFASTFFEEYAHRRTCREVVKSLKESLPTTGESGFTMVDAAVEFAPVTTIVFTYEAEELMDDPEQIRAFKMTIANGACNDEGMRMFIDEGNAFQYVWRDAADFKEPFSLTLESETCYLLAGVERTEALLFSEEAGVQRGE